jgi:hypothetical protein
VLQVLPQEVVLQVHVHGMQLLLVQQEEPGRL